MSSRLYFELKDTKIKTLSVIFNSFFSKKKKKKFEVRAFPYLLIFFLFFFLHMKHLVFIIETKAGLEKKKIIYDL